MRYYLKKYKIYLSFLTSLFIVLTIEGDDCCFINSISFYFFFTHSFFFISSILSFDYYYYYSFFLFHLLLFCTYYIFKHIRYNNNNNNNVLNIRVFKYHRRCNSIGVHYKSDILFLLCIIIIICIIICALVILFVWSNNLYSTHYLDIIGTNMIFIHVHFE